MSENWKDYGIPALFVLCLCGITFWLSVFNGISKPIPFVYANGHYISPAEQVRINQMVPRGENK